MRLAYPACFYPEESGGYSVVFPDLGECATQGDTLENAMEMAVDAASGWLLLSVEQGEKLPSPTELKDITPEYSGGFVSLVLLDLDAYSNANSNKLVKKTLTIPAWLNTAGEKNNINFSAALKDAVIQQLQQ